MRLSTTREVIDALGGVDAVCELLREANINRKNVYHWSTLGQFPARTHYKMKGALKRLGHQAPNCLWNVIGARQSA